MHNRKIYLPSFKIQGENEGNTETVEINHQSLGSTGVPIRYKKSDGAR